MFHISLCNVYICVCGHPCLQKNLRTNTDGFGKKILQRWTWMAFTIILHTRMRTKGWIFLVIFGIFNRFDLVASFFMHKVIFWLCVNHNFWRHHWELSGEVYHEVALPCQCHVSPHVSALDPIVTDLVVWLPYHPLIWVVLFQCIAQVRKSYK